MTGEEKITREKHPGRVAQGHKLAALMKKRKEEILRDKEQFTVQSTEQSREQSSVQSTLQSTEQSSVKPSVQSTVQSNSAYIYGVGIVAVLATAVCVFFAYNKKSSQGSNKENQEQPIKPPKRRNML